MSERIRFSSASELLREDTFEAERLMEMHTFKDAKERELQKLKMEEKELQQIIADQKELIGIFGASVGMSSESLSELPMLNGLQNMDSLYSRSKSARNKYDLEDNEKGTLYPSGSASNLFAELDKELQKQPNRENSSAHFNTHPSHVFAQSRQNFYQKVPPELVLQSLEQTQNFTQYFQKYPLSIMFYCTLFSEEGLKLSSLSNLVESWDLARRTQFFQAFFQNCRQLAHFRDLIANIYSSTTIFQLTSFCEVQLSRFFDAPRSIFLRYEPETDELVFQKEKISLRFPLKPGIFQRCITSQNPIDTNVSDPEVTIGDRPIIQTNKSIFLMPVLSVVTQYQVDGILCIFDKNGGMVEGDYLTASMVARAIALMIPGLEKHESTSKRIHAFQHAVFNFVSLCTDSEMSAIVEHIITNFSNFFNCESVKLFKVSKSKNTIRELTKFETLEEPLQLTGIVGSSISQRKMMNITKPQFSEHYDPIVDCFDENAFSSSLLVAPLQDKSTVYWAVVLYNKKEIPSFTSLDEEALTTICEHMLPILNSAWENKKLKKTIKKSKKQVDQAEALTDVIASLKTPDDLDTMVQRMTKFFRDNSNFTNVSLFVVDRFRNELIDQNSQDIEVIPLNTVHPAAKCAKTGSVVEVESDDNNRILYFPALNTCSSVIGVIKLLSLDTLSSNPVVTEKLLIPRQSSSLSLLNSFRSSMSSGRLLSWSNAETGRGSSDEPVDESSLMKMIKMWQRICGSVLEGALKDQYYNRKRKLIEYINSSLYENQFDCSFKVWQEVQILVDDFKPLDASLVDIECPQINDIVFSNTADLTEKTINLLKALSGLNGIDTKVYQPQRAASTNSILTVIEDEGVSSAFLSTTAIDILKMNEDIILKGIIQTFQELGVLQFFGANETLALNLVLQIRALHPPKLFHSWRLAVDHFQYAAFLLLSSGFVKMLTEVEMVSILLFLLTLYSDPKGIEGGSDQEKTINFALETSGIFSTVSSFFTACAWTDMALINSLNTEEKAAFWRTMDELEVSGQVDCFVNATPAIILCSIARQSILLRETDVAERWSRMKMEESLDPSEKEDLEEMMKIHLQFERDVIVLPMLEEAVKYDPSLSSLITRLNINLTKIIGDESQIA